MDLGAVKATTAVGNLSSKKAGSGGWSAGNRRLKRLCIRQCIGGVQGSVKQRYSCRSRRFAGGRKLLQQKLQADRVFPSACDRLRPSDLHDQREWDGDLRYNELAPDGIGPVYGPIRHDANAPFAYVLDPRVSKLFPFSVWAQHEKLPDSEVAGSWMPPVPPSFLILCFANLHWTFASSIVMFKAGMVFVFADIR